MNETTVKYFYLAKKKWPVFPFETVEEFDKHLGPKPTVYGRDVYVVLTNYDKPKSKKSYVWGTRSDEMKARLARKKTYIWKE
jgi:hypothetical protein